MFAEEAPKILCYFTSWSNKRPGAGRFEPNNIDPFLCTHVIYAFATLENHRLAPGQASDIGDGFAPGTFELLVNLKEKNPNLKVRKIFILHIFNLLPYNLTLIGYIFSFSDNVSFRWLGIWFTTIQRFSIESI